MALSQKEALLDSKWDDGSHAIEDVEGRAMNYGELRSSIRRTVARLNGAGYGRGDRLATVFGSGAEQLAALVSLMTGFTLVPINPNSKDAELERHLRWTGAKAVVVDGGAACPAAAVARRLGIEVYELVKEGSEGKIAFGLKGRGMDAPITAQPQFTGADDTIAVFATSGTTAKPKLVPLRHFNVRWAHQYYQNNCRLTEGDRYLSFLPMFYAFGLLTPLLALANGGCVVCAPGFDPGRFYEWLGRSRATWLAAGPTNYQAILEQASENAEVVRGSRLRLIMTGNAVMPEVVMERLEALFRAPVMEVYAMTEAVIITCAPLGPGKGKRGSAGISWGTEVAIMGEGGTLLPTGAMGEIVIRGKVVMGGYENDDRANALAFRDGWFRTGDVGFLDGDGFLFIKGRIKDMINRGGEKVVPQEVEEVLLAHPAVKEAVVFPVKHQRLGEDVVAAVVPRDGVGASDSDLMIHVSKKLALYKVPSRIVMVTELPKGATGKLSRVAMAESLGLAAGATEPAGYEEPRSETEARLVRLLEGVFTGVRVGVKDNFFDLGGYSLMAVRLFAEIDKEFGVTLPLSTLFQHPTVEGMAAFLEGWHGLPWRHVIPLQTNGSGVPLFLVHGGDGDILNYKDLVQALGNGRRIFGIQARGLDGKEEPDVSVVPMAREYLKEVTRVYPGGSCHLMGFSAGGVIAFEMARQLEAEGRRAAFVGIIDMDPPEKDQWLLRRSIRRTFFRQLSYFLRDLMPNSPKRRARMDLKLGRRARLMVQSGLASLGIRVGDFSTIIAADAVVLPEARKRVWLAQTKAVLDYRLGPYGGRVVVFKGEGIPFVYPPVGEAGWEKYAKGGIDVFVVPGRVHGSQLRQPNVEYLAALANALMGRAEQP